MAGGDKRQAKRAGAKRLLRARDVRPRREADAGAGPSEPRTEGRIDPVEDSLPGAPDEQGLRSIDMDEEEPEVGRVAGRAAEPAGEQQSVDLFDYRTHTQTSEFFSVGDVQASQPPPRGLPGCHGDVGQGDNAGSHGQGGSRPVRHTPCSTAAVSVRRRAPPVARAPGMGVGARWCKSLYTADPSNPGALLRMDVRMQDKRDHNKIVCRICGKGISFSGSSYSSAEKHVRSHGVTREALELAVEMCDKAESANQAFPMDQFKDALAARGGERKVTHYMQEQPYAVGGQLWKEMRAAIARWIATDSIQLSVVESPAFRTFCRALNGRCPWYSRKTISNQVCVYMSVFPCSSSWLSSLAIMPCCWMVCLHMVSMVTCCSYQLQSWLMHGHCNCCRSARCTTVQLAGCVIAGIGPRSAPPSLVTSGVPGRSANISP